jgi:hypothetical protein
MSAWREVKYLIGKEQSFPLSEPSVSIQAVRSGNAVLDGK